MVAVAITTEKIIKSKNRVRDNGEVFTPSWLIEDMLNLIPDEEWADPKKIFLEPACGNGNFLVVIYKKKIVHGSTPLQALQTIYGIDIMPDNILECKKRLLSEIRLYDRREHCHALKKAINSNIRLGDSLKFSMEDIFAPFHMASIKLILFRQQQQKEYEQKIYNEQKICYNTYITGAKRLRLGE